MKITSANFAIKGIFMMMVLVPKDVLNMKEKDHSHFHRQLKMLTLILYQLTNWMTFRK